MNKGINFIFFGTSRISVIVLDELAQAGYTPSLIVTVPDKPQGRKHLLTPPKTKVWGMEHNIPVLQLDTLKTPDTEEKIRSFAVGGFDVGIVASYGLIIPQNVLDIPKRGMLNVHPSLLPKLRGASPIKSAIFLEKETGVTIMHLDSKMDHGPIVAQEKTHDWSDFPGKDTLPYEEDLESELGKAGGELLVKILPDWIQGKIEEKEQDHESATFCKKIEKIDGELNLEDSPEINLRKIRAYHVWPQAYFWFDHNGKKIRVIVKRAKIENNALVIERVLPEGKKEMDYAAFLRGNSRHSTV